MLNDTLLVPRCSFPVREVAIRSLQPSLCGAVLAFTAGTPRCSAVLSHQVSCNVVPSHTKTSNLTLANPSAAVHAVREHFHWQMVVQRWSLQYRYAWAPSWSSRLTHDTAPMSSPPRFSPGPSALADPQLQTNIIQLWRYCPIASPKRPHGLRLHGIGVCLSTSYDVAPFGRSRNLVINQAGHVACPVGTCVCDRHCHEIRVAVICPAQVQLRCQTGVNQQAIVQQWYRSCVLGFHRRQQTGKPLDQHVVSLPLPGPHKSRAAKTNATKKCAADFQKHVSAGHPSVQSTWITLSVDARNLRAHLAAHLLPWWCQCQQQAPLPRSSELHDVVRWASSQGHTHHACSFF